jgi:hypothetical protein
VRNFLTGTTAARVQEVPPHIMGKLVASMIHTAFSPQQPDGIEIDNVPPDEKATAFLGLWAQLSTHILHARRPQPWRAIWENSMQTVTVGELFAFLFSLAVILYLWML